MRFDRYLFILLGGFFILLSVFLVTRADSSKTIHADNFGEGEYECNSDEWHFVINQIDEKENAPESIRVIWTNEEEADLTLNKFTGGVAHYISTGKLDSIVKEASTEIYNSWDGQFNLSHGPCREQVTPPTDKPVDEKPPNQPDQPDKPKQNVDKGKG